MKKLLIGLIVGMLVGGVAGAGTFSVVEQVVSNVDKAQLSSVCYYPAAETAVIVSDIGYEALVDGKTRFIPLSERRQVVEFQNSVDDLGTPDEDESSTDYDDFVTASKIDIAAVTNEVKVEVDKEINIDLIDRGLLVP